jgi:hypothetical protein
MRRKGSSTAAYVPFLKGERGVYSILRVIANPNQLNRLGVTPAHIVEHFSPCLQFTLKDSDLIAHLLGRWAGNLFTQRDKKRISVAVLLKAFASFFSYAHDAFYHRDFDSDNLSFYHSTNPKTTAFLTTVRASIRDRTRIFSIIAQRGAAEMIKNFPEDVHKEIRIHASQWKPADPYFRLLNDLGTDEVSYIGMPLKVDDAVIGVVTMLVAREEPNFYSAGRFIRTALSETGRTIDKTAISRTAHIIRQFAASKPSPSGERIHLPALGRELVTKLVNELLPFGSLKVGSHQLRPGVPEEECHGIDGEAATLINQQLLQTIRSSAIEVFVYHPSDKARPIQAVTLVPFPAALPFVLSITGSLALLTGRSLRTALEQLQAVLIVALAASEQLTSGGGDNEFWRAYLAVWAQVHDLKNRAASFHRPLHTLVATAEHGTYQDLTQEVDRFRDDFALTLRDFEIECDRILRGTGFRRLTKVQLPKLIEEAWTIIRIYPEAIGKCTLSFADGPVLELDTFEWELKIVLENLFMNVIKHFQRTSFGITTVSAKLSEDESEVILKLWDNVPEDDAYAKTKASVTDAESQQTLSMFVRPIVERLLCGAIWVEEEPSLGTVVVVVKIPREIKPH